MGVSPPGKPSDAEQKRKRPMTNQALALEWAAKASDYPLPQEYNAQGSAREPDCGDLLELRLQVDEFGRVMGIGFSLTESACPPVWACAAYACSLCLGKPVMLCLTIDHSQLFGALSHDGKPDPAHIHCAIMVELALKRALADYGRRFCP